jgi:ABC-2 type transport system ATP-binding protein
MLTTPALPTTPLAPPGALILEVDHISVQFGKLRAVDNVTFSLRGGDLLGLIGPNGAGKTTLLRAITGLTPPVTGSISILGDPITDPATRHKVGWTSDTPPMYDQLSVENFLLFIGEAYGLSRNQTLERIDFWLEQVWLKDKAKHKIRGLSRGMKQRVGIARTLLVNPALIVLDEPAAGLDPAGRAQFRELLLSLRRQGCALIVSSHILSDLSEYCSHIGIMSHGRMIEFKTVAELVGTTDIARARYAITLATPQDPAMLSDLPTITPVTTTGTQWILECPIGPSAAHDLLRTLIQRNLPIISFTPHTANLEEIYLNTGVQQVD